MLTIFCCRCMGKLAISAILIRGGVARHSRAPMKAVTLMILLLAPAVAGLHVVNTATSPAARAAPARMGLISGVRGVLGKVFRPLKEDPSSGMPRRRVNRKEWLTSTMDKVSVHAAKIRATLPALSWQQRGSESNAPNAAEIEAYCRDPLVGCNVDEQEQLLAEAARLREKATKRPFWEDADTLRWEYCAEDDYCAGEPSPA